jgi:hypothetical protein
LYFWRLLRFTHHNIMTPQAKLGVFCGFVSLGMFIGLVLYTYHHQTPGTWYQKRCSAQFSTIDNPMFYAEHSGGCGRCDTAHRIPCVVRIQAGETGRCCDYDACSASHEGQESFMRYTNVTTLVLQLLVQPEGTLYQQTFLCNHPECSIVWHEWSTLDTQLVTCYINRKGQIRLHSPESPSMALYIITSAIMALFLLLGGFTMLLQQGHSDMRIIETIPHQKMLVLICAIQVPEHSLQLG